MGKESLYVQIAYQCAPVLAGIKPSNLLILHDGGYSPVLKEAARSFSVSCALLWKGEGRRMWIFYREEQLEQILQCESNQTFLASYGYRCQTLDIVMARLKRRMRAYCQERGEFPHEIGLILGYPLADVQGFIENKGKNFLYSGYWKVYSNEEEARKRFARYTKARREMVQKALLGKEFCKMTPSDSCQSAVYI